MNVKVLLVIWSPCPFFRLIAVAFIFAYFLHKFLDLMSIWIRSLLMIVFSLTYSVGRSDRFWRDILSFSVCTYYVWVCFLWCNLILHFTSITLSITLTHCHVFFVMVSMSDSVLINDFITHLSWLSNIDMKMKEVFLKSFMFSQKMTFPHLLLLYYYRTTRLNVT